MNKKRHFVFDKYNGLCAYTGKPLGDDWQIDHMTSKSGSRFITYIHGNAEERRKQRVQALNHIDNLMPTCRIINHYKRSHDLESFRKYMLDFHKRLAKLPKKTNVARTEKRKEYMFKVAELFGITQDIPFSGVFYFEIIK